MSPSVSGEVFQEGCSANVGEIEIEDDHVWSVLFDESQRRESARRNDDGVTGRPESAPEPLASRCIHRDKEDGAEVAFVGGVTH